MADFPILSTGAITQYPLTFTSGQKVQVIRFLDGSDQRYLTQGRSLRQWQIRLDLLNETEIQEIEAFFLDMKGDYSTFNFPDPVGGGYVSNCQFAAPGLVTQYLGVDDSATTFWVIETVVESHE